MLTRPPTLNESDDRGRGLVAVTPHPDLPLAVESDGDTETGVFSSPGPPGSVSSSSSSASAPLPFSSSLSSCPGLTHPSCLSSPSLTAPVRPLSCPSFSSHVSLLSPPSSLCPPEAPPLSSPSSTCPAPPPVVTLAASLFAPLSSSHPVLPSFHSSAPSLSSACSPPPPPSPPQVFTPLSRHNSLSLFSAPSLLYHCSPLISPPPAQPSVLYPSSSSPSIHPCPSSQRPAASSPSTLPPTPPYCCPCSSLLPRILSAHRLEVRRLLRGALASLGRRLDSLERRRGRRKRTQGVERGGSACAPGLAAVPLSPTSLCSPTLLPPVTTGSSSSASSSDAKDSHTLPLPSNLSQSEHRSRRGEVEGRRRGRKRRRNNHRGREMNEKGEDPDEVEAAGRFVGRMVVSIRRGTEEEETPLTLHNFNYKQPRGGGAGSSQPEKAVTVVRRNGFRAPLHSASSSSSQNALHISQSAQTCSQSEALSISSGQWHFADLTTPLTLSSNHRALHLWLCSSSSFRSPPILRFSAAAMAMMSEAVRGGASWRPLRCLKDRTAPHSLSSDHCYVLTAAPSPAFPVRRQQKQQANRGSRYRCIPWRRTLPLPSCSANGLSALLPAGQSAAGSELLSTDVERGKRVSQIRIRRASPRDTSLTPMGLPKVKRLKKKEFSLEEIYTNKNYRSPSSNRSLETIFEEPREKDGALLLIGQQKRRRLLLFPDFTQPRKRKRLQGAGLPFAMVPRKRAAARRHYHGDSPNDDESDLDVMLVERLSALEEFLTRKGLDV